MNILDEYHSAARWCANRGLAGMIGQPLPGLLSHDTMRVINDNPAVFARAVTEARKAIQLERLARVRAGS